MILFWTFLFINRPQQTKKIHMFNDTVSKSFSLNIPLQNTGINGKKVATENLLLKNQYEADEENKNHEHHTLPHMLTTIFILTLVVGKKKVLVKREVTSSRYRD
jgi:hypothetical protein